LDLVADVAQQHPDAVEQEECEHESEVGCACPPISVVEEKVVPSVFRV